jgi:hypothetical protein
MFAAYYVIIVMLRFVLTGVISAVITDGAAATTALCIVYAVNIVIVVLWRPFSNSFLFFAETVLLAVNLFSLVLVRYGAGTNNDTTTNDLLYGGYLLLQLFGIFILTIPVYIDLILSIVGRVNHKLFKSKDDNDGDADDNNNSGVSEAELKAAKITLGDFIHFWQVMMRHNAAAVLTSLAHKFKRDPHQQQHLDTHKRANSKRVTKVSSALFRGSSVQSEMVDYRSDSSRDMANAQYYLNEAYNHQQPVEHGPRRKSVNNISTASIANLGETSPVQEQSRARKHTSSKALLDENGNAVRQRKNSMTTVQL